MSEPSTDKPRDLSRECSSSTLTFLITEDAEIPPDTLERWAWQCILASYQPDEVISGVWSGTLEYIGWLNELPVKEGGG